MIGSILNAVAFVLNTVFNMAIFLIIVSVFISWFNADPSNQLVRMVNTLTEPMYRPFRKFTSRFSGPIDFAPMLAWLTIVFLDKALVSYLRHLSRTMLE